MIKTLYIFIALALVDPGFLLAQDQLNQSLVSFQEVVQTPGIIKDTVQMRTQRFFSQLDKADNVAILTQSDSLVTLATAYQFKAYRQEIIKNLDGEINYDLTVEIKNDKYRYTITNLLYRKYARNRFSRMVLERGKGRPLKPESFKGQNKTWERLQSQTQQHVAQLMVSLKQSILSPPNVTKELQQTANW